MEKEDKRAAIIDSTVRVVAELGFQGASMAVIASGAGVAGGTIYRYFESKDDLMLEVTRELERRCLGAMLRDYPRHGSVRQRFFHLGHVLIRHFMLFRAEFAFVDQFLSSPYRKSALQSEEAVTRLRSILELFREGVDTRLFKELPPTMLFMLAHGPMIQSLRANVAGILHLNEERISETVKACWDAVAAEKISDT